MDRKSNAVWDLCITVQLTRGLDLVALRSLYAYDALLVRRAATDNKVANMTDVPLDDNGCLDCSQQTLVTCPPCKSDERCVYTKRTCDACSVAICEAKEAESSTNTAAIIGGVVGGVVFVVLVAVFLFIWRKRKHPARKSAEFGQSFNQSSLRPDHSGARGMYGHESYMSSTLGVDPEKNSRFLSFGSHFPSGGEGSLFNALDTATPATINQAQVLKPVQAQVAQVKPKVVNIELVRSTSTRTKGGNGSTPDQSITSKESHATLSSHTPSNGNDSRVTSMAESEAPEENKRSTQVFEFKRVNTLTRSVSKRRNDVNQIQPSTSQLPPSPELNEKAVPALPRSESPNIDPPSVPLQSSSRMSLRIITAVSADPELSSEQFSDTGLTNALPLRSADSSTIAPPPTAHARQSRRLDSQPTGSDAPAFLESAATSSSTHPHAAMHDHATLATAPAALTQPPSPRVPSSSSSAAAGTAVATIHPTVPASQAYTAPDESAFSSSVMSQLSFANSLVSSFPEPPSTLPWMRRNSRSSHITHETHIQRDGGGLPEGFGATGHELLTDSLQGTPVMYPQANLAPVDEVDLASGTTTPAKPSAVKAHLANEIAPVPSSSSTEGSTKSASPVSPASHHSDPFSNAHEYREKQ
ncbi:hypothetical protein H4R34_001986 [Dimargaris verticillata]|uniref:Membrane anchor Opy2 N-terminal domain-containing protein n=1 Tax=Dimargaris verticillata TaxID=2761393 RepID=A0A9W8BAB5_9FUNG|nr:hypothetical protein H4R34_001986 [Dimargaris verticillata]